MWQEIHYPIRRRTRDTIPAAIYFAGAMICGWQALIDLTNTQTRK